jgi:hypothetical protein
MTQEHEQHPAKSHRDITTFSGERVNSLQVRERQINQEDEVRGLSMQTRYLGQIRDFYSIAEHSVLVSRISEHFGDDTPTVCASLEHDGHEYLTGDFPSPFKHDVPGLRTWEGSIEAVFRKARGLPPNDDPVWTKVKRYDLMALHFEASQLMNEPADWIDWEMVREVPDWAKIRCFDWRQAASIFRSRARQLGLKGF